MRAGINGRVPNLSRYAVSCHDKKRGVDMSNAYPDYEKMVTGVSQQTGVAEADVRKVLSASFDSTKAYIVQELQKGAEVVGQRYDREDHVSA